MSNEADKRFYNGRCKFARENGKEPSRAVMSWKLWRELIEPHLRYMPMHTFSGEQKTMFEGVEILRTYDGGDVMEFLP